MWTFLSVLHTGMGQSLSMNGLHMRSRSWSALRRAGIQSVREPAHSLRKPSSTLWCASPMRDPFNLNRRSQRSRQQEESLGGPQEGGWAGPTSGGDALSTKAEAVTGGSS